MSRRLPASGNNAMPQQTRQNEYFVPRDGIDREVITADICRYLGNDALVRPGNYEHPENGQIIQGYFINAYRNLTSAMIQDLKADSARWDQERRQQSVNRNSAGGGIIASNGVYIRHSNSPPVQYRNSDIHQSRQYYGPTESASYSGGTSSDPYDTPRYPGTGQSGYTGASGAYPQQYTATQGGYTQSGYTQPTQFAPPAGNVASFSGHPVTATGGFGQPNQEAPYNIVGANLNLRAGSQTQADYGGNDHTYGASRDPRGDPRDQRVPVTTMASTRTTYTTAGPTSQTYATSGSGANYYPQSAPTANTYPQAAQPGDPFYGRAGTAPYSAAPDQQYESTPALKRLSGPSQNTQLPSSGSSRHRSERESVERHTVDRHSDSRHRAHRPVR
ncbi:hypothetical protein F5Y19DRAFT_487296 [Xylariaceae sp. FL1651]|nr:hypothetical protein F5Y19DRAFT_487296 [Xylariaceae sp. FL1651]